MDEKGKVCGNHENAQWSELAIPGTQKQNGCFIFRMFNGSPVEGWVSQ